MDVKDKTAAITGGASGIGYSCVEQLLHHNAKSVAILDLPSSKGKDAVEQLTSQFGKGRAFFFACDVTSQEQVESSFKKVVETLGALDILINSAGCLDNAMWDRMIDINVAGLVRTTLLGIDIMGKHNGGRGGTIVNVSSVAGVTPAMEFPIYCATKYAVVGLTASLQGFYDRTGVRMLLMCPGLTNTPLTDKIVEMTFLSFVDRNKFMADMEAWPRQPPVDVAKAMVKLIEKGKNGAVCIVMPNEPPCVIDIPTYDKLVKHEL